MPLTEPTPANCTARTPDGDPTPLTRGSARLIQLTAALALLAGAPAALAQSPFQGLGDTPGNRGMFGRGMDGIRK